MKTIGEITNSLPPNALSKTNANSSAGNKPSTAGSTTSRDSGLSESAIVKIWSRMAQMYGHKWISAYGAALDKGALTDTAQLWRRSLSGLTSQQIANGLSKCLERSEAWPPSLPEFRGLCTAMHDPAAENAGMYRAPKCLSLPKPKKGYDHFRPFVQGLRSYLGGVKEEGGQKAEPFVSDPERRKAIEAEIEKAMRGGE